MAEALRRAIVTPENAAPADADVRQFVVARCRGMAQDLARIQIGKEDAEATTAMADLTEAQRAQVRALILSFR